MKASQEFIKDISDDNKDLLLLLKETAGMVSYYRKLLEKMELDALTGLSGSSKFHDCIGSFNNNAEGVGVIYFDVNDLKYYNDNMGHKAGDMLLQKSAESLIFISGGDIRAFRTGGDEFVVITVNQSLDDIRDLVDKWRNNLDELNSRDDGIFCSISVGFALGCKDDLMDDILKSADELMYQDKLRIKAAKGEKPR